MQKILAVFLALALLVSSSGVTLAAVTCTRQATSKQMMCSYCHKTSSGISFASKSCCQKITKFFAVKSEFGKPAQANFDLSQQLLPLMAAVATPVFIASPLASLEFPASPPSSLEKCALTSAFRI